MTTEATKDAGTPIDDVRDRLNHHIDTLFTALSRISAKGCQRHDARSRSPFDSCRAERKAARDGKGAWPADTRERIAAGEHLCPSCLAQDALATVEVGR